MDVHKILTLSGKTVGIHENWITNAVHNIYEINLDKDIVNCLQDVMSKILLELFISTTEWHIVHCRNKCIGDDTKAAVCQSLNCIENKKITYRKKRFTIWRMEFLNPAMWHDLDIDFVGWLHPAMWHVALESWQWIHQVAAPCNVIRGSGMTCNWIRSNVRHIGILHLVSISTTSLHSTCHSAPVSEILSKSDHPRQKNN